MIIGLCGWIGTGKDTVADYLVAEYGFKRDSFAASLKDSLSIIFSWDRQLLEGRTEESRVWRDKVDPWWSQKLGIPNLTPRWVLQNFGTNTCRNHFSDNIWIASLEHKLINTTQDVVITDLRFPNEIQAVKNAGGIVTRVIRGPEPEWYNDALNYNAGVRRCGWALGKDALEKAGVHPSEYAWIGTEFDAVIDNNQPDKEALYSQVKNLVQGLRAAKAAPNA